MNLTWVDTSRGRALRIEVLRDGGLGRNVSFYPADLQELGYVAAVAAISLWEGEAGLPPRGMFARWRWRRGLRRLEQQIAKEVRLFTTEYAPGN